MIKRATSSWRAIAILALFGAFSRPAIAADIRPVKGPVILVRSGAVDQYLWYATDYVAALVDDRLLGAPGMRELEASSLFALMDKARFSRAKTLVLTVLYKPPTASSVYGVPTVTNKTNLCTVTVPRSDVEKDGSTWAQSVAAGQKPAEVNIKVSGKLPPAQ